MRTNSCSLTALPSITASQLETATGGGRVGSIGGAIARGAGRVAESGLTEAGNAIGSSIGSSIGTSIGNAITGQGQSQDPDPVQPQG